VISFYAKSRKTGQLLKQMLNGEEKMLDLEAAALLTKEL
jgi:hypothetical protein